jgi:hypothetical protein
MSTFYVRHTIKMDVDQAGRDHLWNGRLIGIHFPQKHPPTTPQDPDNESLDPADYPQPGRSAMGVFARLGLQGGYVLAEYWGRPGCLVGIVAPGTQIELHRCKWGGRTPERKGMEAVIKTLPLTRVQELSEVQAAKFIAGRPRQGTAMQWHSARMMVQNFVEGIQAPLTVRDLIPTFQEVLCSEFLRLPTEITGLPKLLSLLLPVGRTMRGLDIYALDSKGQIIAAQVTLQASASCPWKVSALKMFEGEKVTRIFFCEDSEPRLEDGIHFYPLAWAFEKFVATNAGQRWIAEISH